MKASLEIASINGRFLRKEITEATRLKLIFEIRARYEKILRDNLGTPILKLTTAYGFIK